MPSVVVIGASYMDASFSLERVPPLDTTTYAEDAKLVPGGKGLNQAVAARRMKADVTFVSSIGNDFASSYVQKYLLEEKFEARNLLLQKLSKPLPTVAVLTAADHVRMVASPRAAELPPPISVVKSEIDRLASADVWLLTLDFSASFVIEVIDLLDKVTSSSNSRPLLLLNPAPAPSPGELTTTLLDRLNWLVPNQVEAVQLLGPLATDQDDPATLVKTLLSLGPEWVCVTAGRQGCSYGTRKYPNRVVDHGGYSVVPLDTTGASDAFCACLAVYLSEGLPTAEAIDASCAAGALAVSTFGASPSMPERDRLNEFLAHRKARPDSAGRAKPK